MPIRIGIDRRGKPADDVFTLKVGMRLKIGHARLYAVDVHGRYPIKARTVDELMEKANKKYTEAGVKCEQAKTYGTCTCSTGSTSAAPGATIDGCRS